MMTRARVSMIRPLQDGHCSGFVNADDSERGALSRRLSDSEPMRLLSTQEAHRQPHHQANRHHTSAHEGALLRLAILFEISRNPSHPALFGGARVAFEGAPCVGVHDSSSRLPGCMAVQE